MKFVKVKHSGVHVARILCTMESHVEKYSALSQCEYMVYTEALMAGCGGKTRQDLITELGLLGSEVAVSYADRRTTLSIIVLSSKLGQTLNVIERIIEQPNFATKEIIRIKELLTNQLILSEENARLQSNKLFYEKLVQRNDTRYQFSTSDLLKNINNVRVHSLSKLHAQNLKSEWKITLSGPNHSINEAQTFFERLNANTTKKTATHNSHKAIRDLGGHVLVLKDIPSKQNIEFTIGNALPLSFTDNAYPAFVFGMSVLALYGGFSGRLMSIVREKEGLTYGIYGHIDFVTDSDTGMWRIATFFSPKDTKQGIVSTLREIERIAKKGITKNELTRFKSILTTREALLQDSLFKKSGQAHSLLLNNISNEMYTNYKKRIQNLSLPEVNAVLRKYLTTDTLLITGAGPVKGVKKQLEEIF